MGNGCKGFGAGYYTADVGSAGAFEEGSLVMGEYWGSLVLTADFGAEAHIHGSVDDIHINGYAHTPSEPGVEFSQEPVDGQMRLNAATFSADGNAVGSVSIVGNDNVVRSDGIWGVELSKVPDDFDNPRAVAGTSSATYTSKGGSEIILIGVLYGLSEPPAGDPAMVTR